MMEEVRAGPVVCLQEKKANKTVNISNKVLTWELGCHGNRKS
jgi:hypothetical protein